MVLMASAGKAIDSISILNPTVATIQPTTVDPRLEPMITPSAFLKGIIPASTKPRVIRDTTEELCNSAVTSVPPSNAREKLEVFL